MKKNICLFSALVLMLILSSCVIKTPLTNSPDITENSVPTTSDSNAAGSSLTESNGDNPNVGVVFLDDSGVRITAPSLVLNDELWGPELKVRIENNTERNITAQVKYAAVNKIMTDAMLFCDVPSGNKADDAIIFLSESLTRSNITAFKDVELFFEVLDTDTWETLLTTGPVYISMPLSTPYEQELDDSGVIAVDEDSFKIVIQDLDTESAYGADLYVYIENNSDKAIMVQSDQVSVNGLIVYPYFYCDVLPGTKIYTSLTFFRETLDENDISDISEIKASFDIYNLQGWDTLYKSEPVSISYD